MKKITLLFSVLLLSTTHSFAQIKITKIKENKKDHYIATVIGYPIIGQYNYITKQNL
jgi:hypothetical protein